MRLAQLLTFMDEVNDKDGAYACMYGHNGCAVREGGRCSDELWQLQCSDESDEDYLERMEGE